jgi:hypothetical protein
MSINVSEVPKHPLPNVPQPQEPQRPHVQPPTVFVYERQAWEYKVLLKDASDDSARTQEELNEFGRDGWELVAIVPVPNGVQLYLKRLRS